MEEVIHSAVVILSLLVVVRYAVLNREQTPAMNPKCRQGMNVHSIASAVIKGLFE